MFRNLIHQNGIVSASSRGTGVGCDSLILWSIAIVPGCQIKLGSRALWCWTGQVNCKILWRRAADVVVSGGERWEGKK